MSTPQGFVVVGDTDWWSTSNRAVEVTTDNRLRGAVRGFDAGTWRSVVSAGSRVAAETPIYAEFEPSTLFPLVGLAEDPSAVLSTFPGGVSGTVGFHLGVGDIYKNGGGTTQTGLTAGAVGQRLGIQIYVSSGTAYVQFSINGTPVGTAESLTDVPWYLVCGTLQSGAGGRLFVDAGELLYLPAGSQPWGSAALVADIAGYSRAATSFTAVDSDYTLDVFRRTVSGSTFDAGIALCNDAPNLSARRGIFWVEFLFEEEAGVNGVLGLVPRNASTATPFPGNTAADFGYYSINGSKITNDTQAGYGSVPTEGQRVCMAWEPSTGKLYWAINETIQGGGDPEAGTGAAFTTATGDLVPAVTPFQGRWRLCTHASEQLYRPSYAEALDGADLLPEQHFVDRLAAVPSVRREVSYYPWANQRQRGAAIGSLDLINADGMFDALSDYDLRDQRVIAYRTRSDGATVREFTALVDGVTQPAANRCRIALADMTAKLDVRVDSPVFALGSPHLIPSQSRIGSTIASDVAQSTFVGFEVFDRALAVSSWQRSDVGGVSGFERTVNPAGLQSVREFTLVEQDTQEAITNGDFSSWTAGAPNNWTVWTIGTGSVTQSGNAAVIAATDDAGAWHAYSFTSGETYALRIDIDAASGMSVGNVGFALENAAGDFLNGVGGERVGPTIVSAGTLVFVFTASAAWAGFSLYASLTASMTVDSVELFTVTETTDADDAIRYLIETAAGLSSSEWEYTAHFSPYAPGRIGYWSKDRPSVRAVLDAVCESLLLDYYTDAEGVVQLAWLVPPEEVDSADAEWAGEIVEADLRSDLTVTDDYAPRLSTVAEYQRNYAQHDDGDIAGSVTNAVRTYFTSEGRRNELDTSGSLGATDAPPLHPFYAFANGAAVMPRLVVNDFTDTNTPNNSSTTVDNRLILLHRCYAARRRFYSLRIARQRAEALSLRPGGVVELTHARYGLSSGKNLMVTTVDAQLTSPTVALTLWG